MIDIKEETTLKAIKEGVALGVNHYNEVESKSGDIPYKPNMAMFKELLKQGMFVAVTARKDGEMIGYFLMLVTKDLLTGSPSAQELGIFVSEEYRGSSVFIRMEREMTKILKRRGLKEMRIMFKTGHNTDMPARLGYEETERVYQKFL